VSQLEIRLLGSPQILRGDKALNNFISNKVPALLAYLAVTRRAHSRDKLAALLWGEMSDADAKNNLRQALANLKKYFEEELTITRDTIEFTGDAFVDSLEFDSALRSASSLDPQPAAVMLTESLRLYRGDFLEGFHVRDAPDFEDWLLAERSRLRELALQALHTLTHFHTTSGHFSEAIIFATRLLAFDPWREEAHRQLMLLQARTGQVSAALTQYETCKKILEKELGVEPSLETTDLYERIRSARHSARHNIPASATEFIGREKELALLREKLANPACRLITLTGLGGAGKTRLAQEVARSCADMFINGAWLVPLAAIETDGLISAIANAMDFAFGAGDHKKQLLNYLRRKELLLVLDNFEHLLASSTLVADVLKFAPEVKILVTSRERLDVDGEWVVELSGLAVSSMEANQLFVQSAKRTRAEIQFEEHDKSVISDICRLVGGLPLGIEIAAAWMPFMVLTDIKAEIQKSLDFLASTRRDIPERQRSLRAVFEASWLRLNNEEQKIFAALSVFCGGFTREAGERVAGNFLSLLENSLVTRNEERFDLHETLRQFAREKLHAKKKVYNAHAAFFAGWAMQQSMTGEREAFAAMSHELENIKAAWNWSVEQKNVKALASLAPFIKRFLDVQGRYREGVEIFGSALQKLDAPDNANELPLNEKGHLLARLYMYKALFQADLGQPGETLAVLNSCLGYFQRDEDETQVMICLNAVGIVHRFLGQEEKAADYYHKELDLSRQTGNKNEEGVALNNLALTANALGNFQEAERLHRECLALRRELSDYPGLSSTLINLGVALFSQDLFDEAKVYLAEAIEISREVNHTRNLAAAFGNLGGIYLKEGRFEEALNYYVQGLEIHRGNGYRFGIAIALDNVGTAHYHLGHKQEAFHYLKQSIREAREIKADVIALDALVWLACLVVERGEKDLAAGWLEMIHTHSQTDPETLQNIAKLPLQLTEKRDLSAAQPVRLEDVIDVVLSSR